MNIVDALDHQARRRPQAPAFVTPGRVIDYAEAASLVRRLAAALRDRGLGQGDRVALRLPNSPTALLAVLALARLGAVAVPLPPRRPAEQFTGLAGRLGLAATLGLNDSHALPGVPLIGVDDGLLAPVDDPRLIEANAAGGDSLLLITLSSGTTGEPKAMGRSHSRVLRQWEQQQTMRPHGPGVRMLILMGFDSNYAMMTGLRMLFSGATVLIEPDASLRSVVDGVDRLGANHVLASPALVGRLVAQLPPDRLRFPGLSSFRLAGSIVAPALLAQLRRRLTANVCSDYGASEVGALADGDPELVHRVPGCVGAVMPWVQAEAVDASDRPLPAGHDGVLRFRSEVFPQAYLDDPEASAKVFRGGWFYPGDVGRVNADGSLVIAARVDELINIGGTKLRAEEVEEVLLQDEAIREAAAYAVQADDGRTLLLAAVVCRGALDEARTLSRCRSVLGQKAPQRLVQVKQLPRNEAGKVLRQVLAQRTRIASARPQAGVAAAAPTPRE